MLRNTKIFLLIGSVILIVVIIVMVVIRSTNTSVRPQTVPLLPDSDTSSTTILYLTQQASLDTATKSKTALLPHLPISIKGFKASNGRQTDILISSYPNDDPDVVRIEVFGVDYIPDQNDPTTNPDMVAYAESFKKALSSLKEQGVDIKDLHVSLSNRQYIRDVAETWIKTLNLLP